MKLIILAALLVVMGAGCSGTLVNQRATDESKADGIRYFDSAMYELQVFEVVDKGKQFRPVGDRRIVTMADKAKVNQVNYKGSYFSSVNFTVNLNKDGTLKTVGLHNQGSAEADAVSAANAVLSTVRDFKSTQQQKQIDDMQREINLINTRKQLEDLKKGP